MIQANIRGRLGNQLFQYAFAKKMAKLYGEELEICIPSNKNELKDFKIKDCKFVSKNKSSLIQKIIVYSFLVIRKIYSNDKRDKQQKIELKFKKFLNKNGIYFYTCGYTDFYKTKRKYKILIGYFESEKFFEDIKEDIKKEYIPVKAPLSKNKKLYDKLKSNNSVCISIRRGDFVKLGNIVCNEEYYKKAIEKIQELVENPVFMIFSDDINWVKENMKFPKGTLFESGNDPSWENLRLISTCKHFIVSNSTFSWWGQYLSSNEDKIVIAPKKWRNYEIKLDIHQPNWILID